MSDAALKTQCKSGGLGSRKGIWQTWVESIPLQQFPDLRVCQMSQRFVKMPMDGAASRVRTLQHWVDGTRSAPNALMLQTRQPRPQMKIRLMSLSPREATTSEG